MNNKAGLVAILVISLGCQPVNKRNASMPANVSVQGTWRLLTGILIDKGDTTVTDYTRNKEFIKIINNTHFAFLSHDLSKGRNSDSLFSAGGGTYSLKDSSYTEHLAYCNDRQWEGNDFHFIVSVNNDTLIQKGIEKIDSLGINRMNIERYVRIKPDQ